MGLDLVRGGGGRIPFLVGALSLLSIVLLFNWWSLSTENLDLLKQIEDLSEHLKTSSVHLDQCRRDHASLESHVKTLEDQNDKLIGNLELEKRARENVEKDLKKEAQDVGAVQKQRDELTSSLKMCSTELDSLKKLDISKDSVIQSMRVEKADLTTQIEDLKEKITTLTQQLDQAKSANNAGAGASRQTSKTSTAAVPPKVENGNAGNEAKNIAEPDHAVDRVSDLKNEKDEAVEDDIPMDPREMEEMLENKKDAAEDKKSLI